MKRHEEQERGKVKTSGQERKHYLLLKEKKKEEELSKSKFFIKI